MTRRIAALALALLLALSGTCLGEDGEPEPTPAAEPETETSAPAADAPAEPEEKKEETGGGDGKKEEISGDTSGSGDATDTKDESGNTGDTGSEPDADTGEGIENDKSSTGEGDEDNPGDGGDSEDQGDSGDGDTDEGGDNPGGDDSEGEGSEDDDHSGEGGDPDIDNPDEGNDPDIDNPDEGGDPDIDNPDEGSDPDAENPDEDVENPDEGDPTPATLAIEVATAGAAQAAGAWQIPYASPEDAISFRWTAIEGAWYEWTVADGSGSCVNSGSQAECALSLRAQDYTSGSFTLTVAATVGEETLCASLNFALAQAQPPQEERPGRPGFGGRPGGFGGRPSGGFSGARPSGGAAEEAAPEEEQGFHITPATALTDSHAAGTKDMTPYGAASLSLPGETVAALALSGSEPDVRRTDGGSFTAALEGDALTLTCDDAAVEWCVNPLALKALRRSSVIALRLSFGEQSVALPTDLELTGAVYASYRARGYVSKDFELRVSPDGIAAVVDGETYALSDAYELIEM